jgi:ribulose-phosphate 3-epimerase
MLPAWMTTEVMNQDNRTDELPARPVKLAPSILSADFAHLGDQVTEAEKAGADRIHLDVMDGHFVPNISFGPAIVQSIRSITRLPFEVHLMISDPDFYLDAFVEAGADSFLVHWEGNHNLYRTIRRIKALNKPVGIVINPATPALVLEAVLAEVNLVLVMTINPGFGQQAFLPMTLPKIRQVREMIDRVNPSCELELDGGIDATTAPPGVAAGANVLVVGSAIYNKKVGVSSAMKQLQAAIQPTTTNS